jgi:hypothetical protein
VLNLIIEDGVKYEPSDLPYMDYVTVDAGNRFNYSIVWNNQKNDVHPPLYYAILHTICSFFPGKYSVWFAGVINIFFAVLTLYVLRKLLRCLVADDAFVDICSWAFALSAGILSAVSFLRMYIMAMFIVTCICYCFVKATCSDSIGWKFYVGIFIAAVSGALTHYYCIIYLVFACLVFGIWLIMKRAIQEICFFMGTMISSGYVSYLIFPAMIEHVFSGYRGEESIENLKTGSLSDYIDRLRSFGAFINQSMIGGLLFVVIAMAVCVVLWNGVKKRHVSALGVKWCLVIIPSLVYLLVVSKIAVYIDSRYVSPIYAVVFAGALCGVYYIIGNLVSGRKFYIAVFAVCAFITINGWRCADWRFLYIESEDFLKDASRYGDVDCVYVYDTNWKMQSDFYEVSNYKSVTFIPSGNLDMIAQTEAASAERLIVKVMSNSEEILNRVLEMCPNLEGYDRLGAYAYGETYLVE